MSLIFSQLASFMQPLLDLSLNLVFIKDPAFPEDLAKVFRNVRRLFLPIDRPNLLDEVSGNMQLFYDLYSELPRTWLVPAIPNLERLDLLGDWYLGLYPKLDLDNIHFPRLRTRRLIDYSFAHDTQLDWIFSHARTLRHLMLQSCAIVSKIRVEREKRHHFCVLWKELRVERRGSTASTHMPSTGATISRP
ncbi:hypothetical protein BDW74DRAFT_158510 [Aspergillus multicolor]|uniref:uncharacterized protein n=1 Tax=Aspergillus multicolor TaxID=41759 RepID=UPI003CCCB7C4